MNKKTSDINWCDYPCPLPSHIFEKHIHQSILSPIQSLGFTEDLWSECRTFALNLFKQGFIDPISILYTSFKHYYPESSKLSAFTRWLLLDPSNQTDFPINTLRYPIFHSANDLSKISPSTEPFKFSNPSIDFDQIWFFFSISMLIPSNHNSLQPDAIILDNDATRFSLVHKKSTASRLHCLFAVTPSGKYSNQLFISKPSRSFKINLPSNSFTRIIQSTTGDISYEHIQQWLNDFLLLSSPTKKSALLFDPRTTLLMSDFVQLCEQSNIHILTIDYDSYLSNILSPFFCLFAKQWSEANRIDKMSLKSVGTIHRYVETLWYSLRTLKQNEQIIQLFNRTQFWKQSDQDYFQNLQSSTKNSLPKKKKKKLSIKISKTKLPPIITSDPPPDSSPEDILLLILNRQMSISRANKYLPGVKIDYLKYCLSYKMNSSYINSLSVIQLNNFMQSSSTIQWLRRLRSLHFWSCAKQIFLREIYQLTGIVTRKRSNNICGNHNMGSIRSCDEQSPGSFWRAFEEIHHIQFDNEFNQNEKEWNDDFQEYVVEKNLNFEETQLWTVDTFEFPLTKNSTILQLPEWNELRPMNLTPKVTVIYAFSNTGLSTEPYFIFPITLQKETNNDENNSFNQLGHLTPQMFLSWIEKSFLKKAQSPIVLIFCSRLPVLSSTVLASLEQYQIYPFGYPSQRTLPFRYLFERRVRNNRSTNLLSELWKKKLLDQQRTHVLKGLNCTVERIKHYFEEIWPILLSEKRDDDDENKIFEDKCQQAFQQANIHFESNHHSNEMISQLNQLLFAVNQIKQQINPIQILKIKSIDNLDENECLISEQQIHPNEKRSNDENNQIRSSKRPRVSIQQWIPPSKQFIQNLQSQSASLFQFILSLIHSIFISNDSSLSDEQYNWLYAILNQYDTNPNHDKFKLLIETACIVAKKDLVR